MTHIYLYNNGFMTFPHFPHSVDKLDCGNVDKWHKISIFRGGKMENEVNYDHIFKSYRNIVI